MARSSTVYECNNCGSQFPKWQGQCNECSKWNTLVESVIVKSKGRGGSRSQQRVGKLQKLAEIEAGAVERRSSGIGELDRVLGGGIVPGEVVLLVGEPGIGKSTLLTQLSLKMGRVVYVCGEESPGQVKLRVERLNNSSKEVAENNELQLLSETDVDVVIGTVEKDDISLLIIDSVQTLTTGDLTGQAGGVAQIKECTNRLINYAKGSGVPILLVGHVTKDGNMAGPKVLEHMVDAVLSLTGDRYYELRLLRTIKNRFGATDEVGVFRMSEGGMEEVSNPSELFLSEREEGAVGSAVAVIMEGTRPVLVEVQALVVSSELPVPRRVAQGVDVRRVQILLGVLSKYAQLGLGSKDVFVKVVGGMTVKEPAIDLAIALAVASSSRQKKLAKGSVAIGEVGLLGEVRRVSWEEKRVKEAKKLGYSKVYGVGKRQKVAEIVKEL